MRIRVFRNLGRGLPPYTEGQVVDVDDNEAARLCRLGVAKAIVQAVPPKPLAAVPPEPPVRSDATEVETKPKDLSGNVTSTNVRKAQKAAKE